MTTTTAERTTHKATARKTTHKPAARKTRTSGHAPTERIDGLTPRAHEHQTKMLETLIDAVTNNTAPWQRAWTPAEGRNMIAANATTGNTYSGGNALYLYAAAILRGYDHNLWMTYKQGEAAGYKLTPGSSDAKVTLMRAGHYQRKDPKTGEPMIDDNGQPVMGKMFKTFTVFPAHLFEGWERPEPVEAPEPVEPDEMSRRLLEGVRGFVPVTMRPVGMDECPFYVRAAHLITIPEFGQFRSAAAFNSTLLHEAAHATGHESLTGRHAPLSPLGPSREERAHEEIVADMAAFLAAMQLGVGYEPENRHAYLSSWSQGDVEVLRAAMVDAGRAGSLLVGKLAPFVGVKVPREGAED